MSAVDTHMEVWRAEVASESGASMSRWLFWLGRLRKQLKATDREMDGELLEGASDLFDAGVTVESAATLLRGYIDPAVFDRELSNSLWAWLRGFAKCEDCEGSGHGGDMIPATWFQPEESVPCSSCFGSGMHRVEA